MTISGVPGFVEARQRLLPLAAKLAALPPPALSALEAPPTYDVGWSHGRESLQDGRLDVHKGSFYANPTTDDPAADDATVTRADAERYPGFFARNVWPAAGAAAGAAAAPAAAAAAAAAAASLPELEPAFKQLGSIVVDAGLLLAERCDAYVRRAWERRYGGDRGGAHPESLAEVLRASRCHKARLLHYFPPGAGARAAAARDGKEEAQAAAAAADKDDDDDADGWCGMHRDTGALTGLTCAMYTRPSVRRGPPRISCADDHQLSGEEQEEEQEGEHLLVSPRPASPPDARAGLYVRTRSGRVSRADIPPTHLAFQVGQAAAILSGGLLCATPHCVRAPGAAALASGAGADVSRETFAVFLQPDVRAPLRVPRPPTATAMGGAVVRHEQQGMEAEDEPEQPVPRQLLRTLLAEDSGQYRPGDSFGDFAERTVRSHYGVVVGAGDEGGKVAGGAGGAVDIGAREGEEHKAGAGEEAAAPATFYVVHE